MTESDNRKLKGMNTMTAGKTTSRIEQGAEFDLHGHTVVVSGTSDAETIIRYKNGAKRTIDTSALNGFLDLKTFPTSTKFVRPTDGGNDQAWIIAVTGNCCYEVDIVDHLGTMQHEVFTYAELIDWHTNGLADEVHIEIPAGAKAYMPKYPPLASEPEALEFGQARIDDLLEKLEKANKNAEQAEINGQIRINALQREVGEWKAALLTQHDQHVTELLRQHDLHTTELLAKNAEIDRLATKASLLKSPVREYLVNEDVSESELNMYSKDGWQVQHMQWVSDREKVPYLNVVLFRESNEPAPRVTVAETAAAIYGTSASVVTQQPPLRVPTPSAPALNQVIVGLDEKPVSRPLTHNGPRPGDTKRLPGLYQLFEQERQQANTEIATILEKTADNLETLRRDSVNRPSFLQGVQQS